MRPAERFSDRVEAYVRYRPGYPGAVLDVLRRETGLAPDWVVADIGSGTGLSARLFLENGNPVIGVEPNAAMRAAAQAELVAWPRFRSVDGSAEATTLDPASVHMVVAAQAFHWFDPTAAGREAARILTPAGWAVLLWNTRRTEASSFLRGYERLLVEHGTDYAVVRHDRLDPNALDRFFGGPYTRRLVDNQQRLDLEGLKGRVFSSSYTPPDGDPRRGPLTRDLERLFHDHQQDGAVRIEYDTEVFVGRIRHGATTGTPQP